MRKELVRGQYKNGVGHRKLENRNHLEKYILDKAWHLGRKWKDLGTKNKITQVLSYDLSSVDTFIAHSKQLNELQLIFVYMATP